MRRILALALLAAGCSPPANDAPGGKMLVPVPDGKADNYYSNVASEVEVKGTLHVAVTDADDEATRKEKIDRRLTAFGLYLTAYVTDKFRGEDLDGDGKISDDEIFFHNDTYGNFKAMVRNQTVKPGDVTADETGLRVTFQIDLAGPADLQARLGSTFEVKEPKDAVLDPAKVDFRVIRAFDPATYKGELETVRCTTRTLPVPGNAYPQLNAFVADGVLDITLFQGHDYAKERYDLIESRLLFDDLVGWGFTPPVARFEDLEADSGPLVKHVTAGGKPVTVEVRIFHSDMFKTDRKGQHDLALAELTRRDVFFYNGHAGPYFGFYLDAEYKATVDYSEFATAPFTSKQQLFVAQGCQTYSQYADMLYANPNKDESNLDVLTTINFSYGQGTDTLLWNLIQFDGHGELVPRDFYGIVSDLNDDATNAGKQVFYGAIGIEGNPQLFPFVDPSVIGRSCEQDSDCGTGYGYMCGAFEHKRCGVLTLAASACPRGSSHFSLSDGTFIVPYGACF